jgi:hypothetical protein
VSTYRLAIAGRLPDSARPWLADLGAATIATTAACSTLEVHDQSALVGLVNRLHALGLVIEEVDRVRREERMGERSIPELAHLVEVPLAPGAPGGGEHREP